MLCAKREVKYLGHFITDDLSDDRDTERQRRSLYAQGNMLIRKLHMCSENVKVRLFKTFCSPMYTAHIWWNYRKCTIRKLYVAFNDVMRMLLNLPRYSSAVVFNLFRSAAHFQPGVLAAAHQCLQVFFLTRRFGLICMFRVIRLNRVQRVALPVRGYRRCHHLWRYTMHVIQFFS